MRIVGFAIALLAVAGAASGGTAPPGAAHAPRSEDKALWPPTLPRGGLLARWRSARRIAKATTQLRALAETFDRELAGRLIPELAAWCEAEEARDLAAAMGDRLLAILDGAYGLVAGARGP
jgi:hypothetical protein